MVRILFLTGSPVDPFLEELSLVYARDCLTATGGQGIYEPHVAHVSPGGSWRFPRDLSDGAIAGAPPMSPAEGLAQVIALAPDLMVPQMFCIPGMTAYRSAFEVLGVPFVGNTSDVMALSAHKARAKAVVAAAGVRVPQGELLRAGDEPTRDPPVVVKPVASDNSMGVSLVTAARDLPGAISRALEYSDEVLLEEFIPPGREVRVGCLAIGDTLTCLPLEEYPLDLHASPIRTHDAKIGRSPDGQVQLMAKGPSRAWTVESDDPIVGPAQEAALACHIALGARHYSLFDFRIDPDGQPWFIEASPYCSFARASVLVAMAEAAGIPLEHLFADMIGEVLRGMPGQDRH